MTLGKITEDVKTDLEASLGKMLILNDMDQYSLPGASDKKLAQRLDSELHGI